MPMADVRLFAANDAVAWDEYVCRRPEATVFHRLAWSDAVAAAYGHPPLHVAAWDGSRLVGVLPLFEVKSLFVGRVLVSVPYATYGGIVADDPAVVAQMAEFAKNLCRDRRANYLELRHREASGLDLPIIDKYDTFRKQLPTEPEQVLEGLPRKTRTAVRKGLKELGDEAARFGPEWIDTIYDLYAITLRRLGSPNYRRRLFHELARTYGQDCVCMVVMDGGRPVAGVMSFVFRDEIVPYFSGSVAGGMAKRANNVMYLRLMEYAVRQGLRWFDFNRTRRDNAGPYDFKRHMGFEPTPLKYQIHLGQGGKMPNLSPSNTKFKLAGKLWQRIPLCVTKPVGERISKWIP
jgi:FemAB-related protein (PEP-CTERM system-associated)